MKTKDKIFVSLVFLVFTIAFLSVVPMKVNAIPCTQTWTVSASSNDMGVRELKTQVPHPPWDLAALDKTSTAMFIGYVTGAAQVYGGGFVFENITIPKDANITSAYFKVTCYSSSVGASVNTRIDGEAADSSVAFSDLANYNGRTRTSANVWWNSTTWTVNATYTSTDMGSVIQQIVNRAGWSSGNNVTVFWEESNTNTAFGDNYQAVYTYDYGSNRPQLEINWIGKSAPATGEFQAPVTIYANQYSFINYTVFDAEGNTTFQNSTLTIVNGTSIFLWVYNTNTFSEYSDPSNYWTLDTGASLRINVNSTASRLCFKLKAYWNYSEGLIDVNATVFDGDGFNGTAEQTDLFTFEDDLIIDSAAIASSYANPSSSISCDALVYYEGTSTVPEDATGIVGYVELSGVSKGFDATINSSGYFTVTWNSEAILGNHTYTIFAVTDENSVQNKTAWNYVDTLTISIVVADNRININSNASITVSAVYDSDSTVFSGTFTMNETTYTFASACRHNFTVASVSGGTRSPVNQININDAHYVIWDSVTASIIVGDHRIDVNMNASISVAGIYDFDSSAYDGVFTLNYTTWSHAAVSRHNYTVASIAGDSFGITVISTNDEDYVVWDDAKIVSGGVSSSWVHVGDSSTVYYVLQYEFDGTAITDGAVKLNGSDMTYNAGTARWELAVSEFVLGVYAYQINSVSGNMEGITVINDAVGAESITYYANLNVCTIDVENNTILDTAIVFMCNGSLGGPTGGPGDSGGVAYVSTSSGWFSQIVTNGWANWTGFTNSTPSVYVTWHGLTVNVTFTVSLSGDVNVNASCLCYPFICSATRYHAATNATVSSYSFASDVLVLYFSGATSDYVIYASGPHPTYILNCTYNLTSMYTSYLELPHFGNATISIGYDDWGGRYIPYVDQRMVAVWWDAGIKVNMNFTGAGVGQLYIYCGASGCPPSNDGFTVTQYLPSLLFVGDYGFGVGDKTVWVMWSSSSGPSGDGGGTPGQVIGDLHIDITMSLNETAIRGGDVLNGTLKVHWTGDPIMYNQIYLTKLECDSAYSAWNLSVPVGLPVTLVKNLADADGYATVNITVAVPLNVSLTIPYRIPYVATFSLKDGGLRTVGTTLPVMVTEETVTPISTWMIYGFLAVFAVVFGFGSVTRSKRRKTV
jgi:hypothetical protein